MRALFFTLVRKDITVLAARPASWIYMALFAGSSMALAFYSGRFFDANAAALDQLFVFFPIVMMVFIPVMSMDMLAAERRGGTDELYHAMGIAPLLAISAKAFALWLMGLAALALTASLWVVISWLGHPDQMRVISGYFGAALMMAAFIALDLGVAARSKSPVTAFLLALSLNAVLTLTALPALRGVLPAPLSALLADFTMGVHFTSFVRGVLRLPDILFFLSLCGFGLILAGLLWRPAEKGKGLYIWLKGAGVLVFLMALNAIAGMAGQAARIDLTHDKLYTLSPAMRRFAANMKTDRTLTFYYAQNLARHFPRMRQYGAQVRETLRALRAASHGHLRVIEIDPPPDTPGEDKALKAGISPLPTDTGKPLYFGLASDNGAVLARLDPARADSLEYDLAQILSGPHKTKPVLALYDGLDLAARNWFVSGRKPALLFENIAKNYHVRFLADTFSADDLQADVLMLVHPPAFAPPQKTLLRNWLAKGGRALIALDPYSEVSARPGLNGLPRPNARRNSDLAGVLDILGVTFDSGKIIYDPGAAMPAKREQNSQTRTVRQPAWLGLGPNLLSSSDPVTNHLGRGIVMASAGAFYPLAPRQKMQTLARSTKAARADDFAPFAADTEPAKLMAMPAAEGAPYALIIRRGNAIIMADADMLDDAYYVQADPVFGPKARFDNGRLVLNALDMLSGADVLLALRARAMTPRTLTRIEALRATAQRRADMAQSALEKSGQNATDQRAQLRRIRKAFHARLNRLETVLKFITIWLIPGLAVLAGFLFIRRRRPGILLV